jgi:prevent-host-death family protein
MSTLTFRNSLGELVDVPTVAATRIKNEFGAVLEQAVRGGAVAITKHDTPKAVLISYDEFQALVKARSPDLGDLAAEYDVLLARMQTPLAGKGMEAAFNASPAELGRAAVKAAKPASAKAHKRA